MIPYAKTSEIIEDSLADFDKIENKVAWYHRLLLNKPLKVVAALLIVAVIAPLLLYRYIFYNSQEFPPLDGLSTGTCLVPRELRLPCGLGNASASQCHSQCCYDEHNNYCFHRIPSRFSYLLYGNWSEESILYPRVRNVPYSSSESIQNIRISIDEISSTHMSITFYDANVASLNGRRIDNKNYTYEISSGELSIAVRSSYGTIFNTMRGPLIAAENIWEIAFSLTNGTLYGLGEIPLQAATVKVFHNHEDGISSIPLIYAESNKTYHGLLIDAESPTEVMVRTGNNVIVRSITKFGLKFHLFVGPEPKDIMRDVTSMIGSSKIEYWMLGAHICNEITGTPEEKYSILNSFLTNATAVPYESHCGTAPIVFNGIRCENEEDDHELIEAGAQLVRNMGKRFVPHLSPYINFEEEVLTNDTASEEIEIATNFVINNSYDYMNNTHNETCFSIVTKYYNNLLLDPQKETVYVGVAGNRTVIYPIYENKSDEILKELCTYDISLDSVILQNNWPLDESLKSYDEIYQLLPYFNKEFEAAFNKTPLWNAQLNNGEKYFYRHNSYGSNFVNSFKKVHSNEVPLWSSSQRMNGEAIINRQNIDASWTNLRKEIVQAALGGISGHWLWSSPICGDTEHFNATTQSYLCVKWYLTAIYFPTMKIHSKEVRRDPLAFEMTHRNRIINALNQRLGLLPYLYTTLQSGPLLRPMFYQFPAAGVLKNLTTQFSVGDDLLIVPTLMPNQINVHVWMPPGTWYEMWSGLKIDSAEENVTTLSITDAEILTLVRGGSIIPLHKDVRVTIADTRLISPFTLTIVLDCNNDSNNESNPNESVFNTEIDPQCQAEGTLYMTPNMMMKFEANFKNITITAVGDEFDIFCDMANSTWSRTIRDVNVYGLSDEYNNFDHRRNVIAYLDLCDLTTREEIVFNIT